MNKRNKIISLKGNSGLYYLSLYNQCHSYAQKTKWSIVVLCHFFSYLDFCRIIKIFCSLLRHYARTLIITINLPFPVIVPYGAVLSLSYLHTYLLGCISGSIPRLSLVQHSLYGGVVINISFYSKGCSTER